jgi:hypothetical protein
MEPKKIRDEMLPCNYARCCPRIEVFDDGSAVLTDDDAENGSVGTIKLRPEQVARLAELFGKVK